MKLIPNGPKILEIAHVANAHKLALRSKVSYPTVDRYINKPNRVTQLSCEVLGCILTDGLGLSPEQVLELKIGDVFQVVAYNCGE